jgi:hypothetical protein
MFDELKYSLSIMSKGRLLMQSKLNVVGMSLSAGLYKRKCIEAVVDDTSMILTVETASTGYSIHLLMHPQRKSFSSNQKLKKSKVCVVLYYIVSAAAQCIVLL